MAQAVLLVLAKSRISHALCARLGQTQRLIEFPIRQERKGEKPSDHTPVVAVFELGCSLWIASSCAV